MSSEEYTYPNREAKDLDALWADNDVRKKKVLEYRNKIKEYRDNRGDTDYVDVSPLDSQYALGKWRAMIIEVDVYDDRDQRRMFPFSDAKAFVDYWDKNPRDETKVSRRMIILEEIHPRIIELLSVELNIQPEFAIIQAYRPFESSVPTKWSPITEKTQYWKVDVMERVAKLSHEMVNRSDAHCENFLLSGGGSARTHIAQDVNELKYRVPISFWGTNHKTKRSWTSVLAFDSPCPVLCKGPTLDTRIPEISATHLQWNFGLKRILPGQDFEGRKSLLSVFDSYVDNYNSLVLGDDPFTGTYLARDYARQQWEGFTQYQMHLMEAKSVGSRRILADGTNIMTLYNEDVYTREWLQKLMSVFNALMWNFGYRDPDFISRQPDDLRYTLTQEKQQWLRMEDELNRGDTWLANHMAMLAQRASLEEAIQARKQTEESNRQTKQANEQTAASNRMARSSGQLTKLATVVVPFSLVASLFSMNGKFAAGEELFFVYWCISIPVTMVLLIWVLFEDVQQKRLGWMDLRLGVSREILRAEKEALLEMQQKQSSSLDVLTQERLVLRLEHDIKEREWNIEQLELQVPRTKRKDEDAKQKFQAGRILAQYFWDTRRKNLDDRIREKTVLQEKSNDGRVV